MVQPKVEIGPQSSISLEVERRPELAVGVDLKIAVVESYSSWHFG